MKNNDIIPPPHKLIDNWQFIIMNYPFSIMNYEFIIENRSPLFHLIINTYNKIHNFKFLIMNYMEVHDEKTFFSSL